MTRSRSARAIADFFSGINIYQMIGCYAFQGSNPFPTTIFQNLQGRAVASLPRRLFLSLLRRREDARALPEKGLARRRRGILR